MQVEMHTPNLPDVFELHADFCRVFSSATRLRILWRLAEREQSVSELAEALQLSMANLSQHLRVMRDQGAVATSRNGRSVIYKISNRKFWEGAARIREGLLEELRTRGMTAE
jgi:ArsR family transcriptional regulator